MQNALKIRTVGRGDLHSLQLLYRQLNSDDALLSQQDAERIWKEFRGYAGSAIFIGIACGVPVTTCSLVVVPNLTRGGASYALIENVVTDSEHRRRGYAQAILSEAIEAAWRRGCYKVMLLTGSKDPGTLRFYQQVGFEQTKTGFQIRKVPPRKS